MTVRTGRRVEAPIYLTTTAMGYELLCRGCGEIETINQKTPINKEFLSKMKTFEERHSHCRLAHGPAKRKGKA